MCEAKEGGALKGRGAVLQKVGRSQSQKPLQIAVRNMDFILSALGSRWRVKSRRMARSDGRGGQG